MHYHIILTEKCDSKCRYCYEKSLKEFDNGLNKKFSFEFSAPCVSNVPPQKISKFLSQDSSPTLVFYGGEPLLQSKKIKEIIDATQNIPHIKYRMQTNAKLLDKLPKKYLNKITKILVSIDGSKERTDKNRGEGTYDKVIQNIKTARENGYKGEIVARMTIAQDAPDLCEQVHKILKTNLFDSIHWQLDVGFYKFDFKENPEKIKQFLDEYNKSTEKLIKFWLKEMQKGEVHKFYPFIAIAESILKKEKTKLRCGSGHTGYVITTDGKIVACPIMNSIKDFQAGTLETAPNKLKKFDTSEECKNCEVYDLCGGRCLYWRKAKLWPKEGDELICNSIKYYIKKIQDSMPKIQKLIKEGKISKKNFEYEKYFGPEIIP